MFGSAVGREEFNALYSKLARLVEAHDTAMKAIEPLIGVVTKLHDDTNANDP